MVDAVKASVVEERQLTNDGMKHIEECCDTLLKSFKNEFTSKFVHYNSATRKLFDEQNTKVDRISKTVELLPTLHAKIDQANSKCNQM